MFSIQAGVCHLFREFLTSQGFHEVHTPKIISGWILALKQNPFDETKCSCLCLCVMFTKQYVIVSLLVKEAYWMNDHHISWHHCMLTRGTL